MTIYNDLVQLAANIWYCVVKLSIISILAPFRSLFIHLEVLGYPSNEYFSFHTIQVYL